MATCEFCEQEMGEAESCTKNTILFPAPARADGGKWLFAIPFGEEARGIVEQMDITEATRCHDCGVQVGGFHHPGCDVEESPLSGNQLLMEILNTEGDGRPYHARAQGDPHHEITFDEVVHPQN